MLYLKRIISVLFGVAALSLSFGAQAAPFTYSYTGLPFTDINLPQNTSNSISGLFTIDTPTIFDAALSNGNATVSNFSFSDGIQTFTAADATMTFVFNTNIDGDILIDPDLNLLIVSDLDSGDFLEIGNLVNAFGSILGDLAVGPDDETTGLSLQIGTFALVPAIPEPGALALLGIGLAGLGFVRLRRETAA